MSAECSPVQTSVAAFVAWAATSTEALACPVCFAPGDDPVSRAVGLGILALALVTIGVLGAVGAFVVRLALRARAHAGPRAGSPEALASGEGTTT